LHLTTEDGTRGERGRITAPLARALAEPSAADATIYSCGPTPMMRAVAELGEAAGRPVFVSLEQVMGCGMGGCYSCVCASVAEMAATSCARASTALSSTAARSSGTRSAWALTMADLSVQIGTLRLRNPFIGARDASATASNTPRR
jgi:hypothetical protein